MSESHAHPPTQRSLQRRPPYRLLHDRRPAEQHWTERQNSFWDELAAIVGDRERLVPLQIAIADGEGDYAAMREKQLLLAVGTICMANARPDIWRQIYEAWEEVPAPGGEMALLDELKEKAQRGDI